MAHHEHARNHLHQQVDGPRDEHVPGQMPGQMYGQLDEVPDGHLRERLDRRPLLLAASAGHAAQCASALGLPDASWDYLANNATFSIHHAALHVIDCGGYLTPVQVSLLTRLGIALHDALRMTSDGQLEPHPVSRQGHAALGNATSYPAE